MVFLLDFISKTKEISLAIAPEQKDKGQDNRAHLLNFREFKAQFYFFCSCPQKISPSPDASLGPCVESCEHTCVRAGMAIVFQII